MFVVFIPVAYTTVYMTPARSGFPRSIDRRARGCQYRTIRQKALREMFERRPFGHGHYSNCGYVEHEKSAEGGVICTVVYGYSKQL